MNYGKYYFAIVFTIVAMFGLTGSAIAATTSVTSVATAVTPITAVPVMPASSQITLQSTNIFQQIINFFEGLFGVGSRSSGYTTTVPYSTTTICPLGTAGCPIRVTTVSTTTVPQALSSCVAALGIVCAAPTLSSTGALSLTFGQNTGAVMYHPELACSITSTVPSTFYQINSGNPLVSGATIPASGIQCPAVNGSQFNGYLWLSYASSSNTAITMLAATLSLSTTSNITNSSGGYSYTGVYNGTNMALTWVPNHTIENLSDARLVGVITDFQTTNPYYSCLNGDSMNVWSASNEYPGVLVVHNGLQGSQCTYITATFVPLGNGGGNKFPNPYNYTYTGSYKGAGETLSWVPNHTIENDSGAQLIGTLSNFYTANPYYSCLNGESINVWTDPNYPNEYVIHNGMQGPQCTYITAVFSSGSTRGSTPIMTITVNRPQNMPTGTNFETNMSWTNLTSYSSVYNCDFVFQTAGGVTVSNYTEYCGLSYPELGWNYTGVSMQPGGNYDIRVIISNRTTGGYVSASNTGYISVPSSGSTPLSAGMNLTVRQTGTPSYPVILDMIGIATGGSGPYVYTYKIRNMSQLYYRTIYTSSQTTSTSWTYGFYNNTVIPSLVPGTTYSAVVTVTDSQGHTASSQPQSFTIPGNNIPNPYNYTYTGSWEGSQVTSPSTIQWVPNHTIENDSGAVLVGTLTNFQTTNPYYSCLNGRSLNVWTDPNYPNVYVVHNGLQGSQCTYITLELQYIVKNQILYVGHNVTSSPYTVELTDLAQPNNQTNESAAEIDVYYNGALTNTSQINPNSVGAFKVHGEMLYVFVHNTFASLYAYQRWANMSITFP
ncbi:MAG: hypothetical protein LVQ95_03635 [Candidatus Micrarchaeales archaeon]|nr:hypothetical protein [Candidatus Micrarchaeales archaeon]